VRHKSLAFHQTLLEEVARREQEPESEEPEEQSPGPSAHLPSYLGLVDNATRNLLKSMATGATNISEGDISNSEHASPQPDSIPTEGWGLFEASEDTELAMSVEQRGIALIAKSLLDRFEELSDVESIDEADERSDVDDDEVREPEVASKCYLFIGVIKFIYIIS